MDLFQIITPVHIYFLGLLSMEYIDLDKSFMGDNGDVYFRLCEDNLPIPDIDLSKNKILYKKYNTVRQVLEDLFFTTFDLNGGRGEHCFDFTKSDGYYIHFDLFKKQADSFTIGYENKLYTRTHVYIEDPLFLMDISDHPDYAVCKRKFDKFNNSAMDWVMEKIRDILTDVKGEYVKDTINRDTYFQVRRFNGQDIFYIVYRPWDKVHRGSVKWADILKGEGTVYAALND